MKVTPGPKDAPFCACGKWTDNRSSSQWICPECIAIDKKEIGRITHCGIRQVGESGNYSHWNIDYDKPIAGGSLKHLEAMLA